MKKSESLDKQKGKPRRRRWKRGAAIVLLLVLLAPPLLIVYVIVAALPHSYGSAADAPTEPVAVVFGAGITPNRNLTPMLADRVQTAVQLYQQRRIGKMLMTGDGSRLYHDEVTPMERYALSRGVSARDIVLDYAGFSTYESCYRARAIFGVQQAVLVTQRFHLARAIYICRALGIDAVGVGTPDWGVYSNELMTNYTVREALAILKALWDVHIAHPVPTFLGQSESGQLTN